MLQWLLRCRLTEFPRVSPVLFRHSRGPMRESARPFRGVVAAATLSFWGVLERFSTPVRAVDTFTALALRALIAALPP